LRADIPTGKSIILLVVVGKMGVVLLISVNLVGIFALFLISVIFFDKFAVKTRGARLSVASPNIKRL